MSNLEVRQLRYFVAVAEELHFGRAAERLGMAQPPLSRAIREIERQLGVQLLERTTRQVALTPAGTALLRDARTALEAVEAAGRRARNAAEPRLRLAFKADYDAGLLPRMLAEFERSPSALPVELLMGGRDEQAPALRDGRADVALLVLPFDDRGVDVEPLLTEPRVVVLAANDPLAARTSLSLADLAGRELPDGTDAGDGGVAPPPPGSVVKRRDLAQIFSLVEVGSVVWFVPVSLARRHARAGLAFREVTDLTPSTLAVAWPSDSRSPAVAAFVRAAQDVAADPSVLAAGGSYTYS
ncbi:LysR family transcriptional regulator [Cryptosporangium phraense]|uniref:LysR family transcriptional regulator n=1 Tax=Cryptosporangium phraense TaxID=2593070 RepID=A0A545AFJ5_9ACTN|nr:LysR substrate-binding domain-containing protein [Cryptosporangium phraense]TQS40108.1 LysR family transcriptional regulator [Cryptosporangium phraense]